MKGQLGGILMAEYHMTYEEIASIVDKAISETEEKDNLRLYQPAIMAALTGDYEQGNCKEIPEMVALWENMIAEPSQLLLGTRYIRIQGAMIEFIKLALTSGFVDAVISSEVVTPEVSATSVVAFVLYEIFGKASKLEDDDFCVYLQTVTHFREHAEFTEEELMSWFPHGEHPRCNMHNSTWQCDYLGDNDICTIQEEKVQSALKSLKNKGILDQTKGNDGKYVFRFKR